MQGLRVCSAIGAALTSDEIDAAHRVANTHQEMRFGVVRIEDRLTGTTVEYHAGKRLAMTTPGGIPMWFVGSLFTHVPAAYRSHFPLGPKVERQTQYLTDHYRSVIYSGAINQPGDLIATVDLPQDAGGVSHALLPIVEPTVNHWWSGSGSGHLYYVASEAGVATLHRTTFAPPADARLPKTVAWTDPAFWIPPAMLSGYIIFPELVVVTPTDGPNAGIPSYFDDFSTMPSLIKSTIADAATWWVSDEMPTPTAYSLHVETNIGNFDGSIQWTWNPTAERFSLTVSNIPIFGFGASSGVTPSAYNQNDVYIVNGTYQGGSYQFSDAGVVTQGSLTYSPPSLPAGANGINPYTDWIAGAKEAIRRERSRLKAASDDFIARLRAGELPAELDRLIKTAKPDTNNAARSALMEVVENTTGLTRRVTLRYTTDGGETYAEETFEGSQTIESIYGSVTDPFTGAVTSQTVNVKRTFTNYPYLDATFGQYGAARFDYPLNDLSWLTAVVQQHLDLFAKSPASSPLMVLLNGVLYDEPERVASELNTLTVAHPEFVLNFHRSVNIPTDKGADATNDDERWLSTALEHGEVVQAIPLLYGSAGATADDVPFSIYLNGNEFTNHKMRKDMQIKIAGKASFRWDKNLVAFIPLGWSDTVDEAGAPVEKTLFSGAPVGGYYGNFVFFSNRGKAWSDLKLISADQKAEMAAPTAGSNNALFAQVKAAIA